jgi:hypothetical protein
MEDNLFKERSDSLEANGSRREMNSVDVGEDPLLSPWKKEKAKTLSASVLLQKKKKRFSQVTC